MCFSRRAGLERWLRGWRTNCTSRGPEFNSQQPHGASQPSIIRSCAHFWHASR
ncbi:hypothetical protein LEMLEM_LOCUS16369, partial [Lemmus lemmus]